ncbi:hypothetical protein C7I85_26365 [Mesorhizobium soli]|uniref:Uncharacterized protein n=1 Tax=Pseudaminobacter soli (ex Li et al. 2025) TaxID=1295366 RepID=A0A2P7S054_9HYPH|nr:hypothetical protein C7I85_26365 [Mesorhizobium soli]
MLDRADVVVLPETWPFRARFPLAETLEWMTEVLGSRTGEQRLALRSAPRQSFSYSVRLSIADYARGAAFARRRVGTVIGVPVWAEGIDLAVDIAATASILPVDTTAGDWRVNGGVMIWERSDKFVVARITSVSPDSLELLAPIGLDFQKPAIIPLRFALVPEGFSVDRNTTYSDVGTKFLVTDNIDLAAAYVSTYPKYQGLDVVTEAPLLVANVSDSIVRSMELNDNGFGPIVVETLRSYVDFGQTVSFMESRPSGVWKRRKWLHSLRGKQKPFWLPTFNQDILLQANIGAAATTALVRSIGHPSSYIGRHVMILLKDGTRLQRQITNAGASDGGNDTIVISSSLGKSAAPADVALFCFISRVRLNSDSVSIDHKYIDASVVNIPVIEVPA